MKKKKGKKGKKYSRNGICSNATVEVGKFWGDSIWR